MVKAACPLCRKESYMESFLKQIFKVSLFVFFLSILAIPLALAEVYIKADDKIEEFIAYGDKLVSQKHADRAWDFYQKLFLEKYEKIESAMVKTAPGQYQDSQSFILEKMFHLAQDHGEVLKFSEKQAQTFLETISPSVFIL